MTLRALDYAIAVTTRQHAQSDQPCVNACFRRFGLTSAGEVSKCYVVVGWIDVATGIVAFIRRQLGQGFREWAVWAHENPCAAAIQLDTIAGNLEAAAEARRRRRSGRMPWLARRKAAAAAKLRAQAMDLRQYDVCTERVTASVPPVSDPFRKPGT